MKADVDLWEAIWERVLQKNVRKPRRGGEIMFKDQTPGRVSAADRMGVTRLREQTRAGKMRRQQISN